VRASSWAVGIVKEPTACCSDLTKERSERRIMVELADLLGQHPPHIENGCDALILRLHAPGVVEDAAVLQVSQDLARDHLVVGETRFAKGDAWQAALDPEILDARANVGSFDLGRTESVAHGFS
jgi:hypothetical protein